MADQEEEDLRITLRMSMQHSPFEPKWSKPRDTPVGASTVSLEKSPWHLQRELMVATVEKRMLAVRTGFASSLASSGLGSVSKVEKKEKELGVESVNLGKELSQAEVKQLFSMVFGIEVSKDILAQWTNQGIR